MNNSLCPIIVMHIVSDLTMSGTSDIFICYLTYLSLVIVYIDLFQLSVIHVFFVFCDQMSVCVWYQCMSTIPAVYQHCRLFAARRGSRVLQSLNWQERANVITTLASLLESRSAEIIAANEVDLKKAKTENLSEAMQARLKLTPAKLSDLAAGLRQIAADGRRQLGRVLRRTQMADGMELRQVTVPLGVLLVIFESRPDCLPQVSDGDALRRNGESKLWLFIEYISASVKFVMFGWSVTKRSQSKFS